MFIYLFCVLIHQKNKLTVECTRCVDFHPISSISRYIKSMLRIYLTRGIIVHNKSKERRIFLHNGRQLHFEANKRAWRTSDTYENVSFRPRVSYFLLSCFCLLVVQKTLLWGCSWPIKSIRTINWCRYNFDIRILFVFRSTKIQCIFYFKLCLQFNNSSFHPF